MLDNLTISSNDSMGGREDVAGWDTQLWPHESREDNSEKAWLRVHSDIAQVSSPLRKCKLNAKHAPPSSS